MKALRIGLVTALIAAPLVAQSGPTYQERDFLTRIRRLTIEGKRSGEGYWSPDGKRLVFQSEREPENPFYQIYILDFASGESKRISPGIGKTTCAFFRPGSDEIEFASTHADPKSKALQQAELAFRASGQQRRYSWDPRAPEAADPHPSEQRPSEAREHRRARLLLVECRHLPAGKDRKAGFQPPRQRR